MDHYEEWLPQIRALADATRLAIVARLLERDHTVGELARSLDATSYNVSRHLRILREAGILLSVKQGRHRIHYVCPDFRALVDEHRCLDLGCCVFRFDGQPAPPRPRGDD